MARRQPRCRGARSVLRAVLHRVPAVLSSWRDRAAPVSDGLWSESHRRHLPEEVQGQELRIRSRLSLSLITPLSTPRYYTILSHSTLLNYTKKAIPR